MISGILVGLAGGTGGEAAAGAVGPGKQCFLKQEVAGQFPINGVLLGTDQDIPVFVTGQSVDEKGAPLVDTDGKPLWDVTFLGLGMASRRADRPADRVMRSVLLTAPDTITQVKAELLVPNQSPVAAAAMRSRLENLQQMNTAVQAWVARLPSEVAKAQEVDLAKAINDAKTGQPARTQTTGSPIQEETESQLGGESSKRARSPSSERRVRPRKTLSHLLGENEEELTPGAFTTKLETLVSPRAWRLCAHARERRKIKGDSNLSFHMTPQPVIFRRTVRRFPTSSRGSLSLWRACPVTRTRIAR